MSKTILEFTGKHGPYVKGDIAGFEADVARKIKATKKAKDYEPKEADKADAATTKKSDNLAQREKALVKKEAALKKREAAIAKAEKPAAKAAKGTPPAQGAGA
ncbi:MAG: hypothetical protein ABJP33_07770 [Pseudoruegeria sp.]